MQRTILDRKGKGTLSISLALAFSRALSATVAFIIGLEKICLSRRGVLEMTFVCFNFENGSIESLPYCPHNSRFVLPPPIWFTPNIRPSNVQYHDSFYDLPPELMMDMAPPPFSIGITSPKWALCGEETQVYVYGHFNESYEHLEKSKLLCVIGESYVRAELFHPGVYRCFTTSYTPGIVKVSLSLDDGTSINDKWNLEFHLHPCRRLPPCQQSFGDELVPSEEGEIEEGEGEGDKSRHSSVKRRR